MPHRSPPELTVEQLVGIDKCAEAFEADWRAGLRPRIEDPLEAAPEGTRDVLRDELVLLECELRRERGETIDVADYHRRFPNLDLPLARSGDSHDEASTIAFDGAGTGAATAGSNARPELAQYVLIDRIGSGGLGVVFLAHKRDRVEEHRLALKMLQKLDSPELAERFLAEMAVMARLQHPHIVPILDSGNDCGVTYFVMPFFARGDLAQALKKAGPLPPQTAVEYILRVAWAVAYLHEKQILHRDLKPSNILLDDARDSRLPFGRPCLADFGLVKLLGDPIRDDSPATLEGTIPYMAPEQAQGQNATLGPACDIWGLGVILYELLTGERPFLGRTQSELRDQIVHREPPLLRSRIKEIPRDLQRIVNTCLEKRPENRYRTVPELIDDLDALLRNEPLVKAKPLGLWESIERWTRRRPALATRWGVVALVITNVWISRIYILLGGGRPPGNQVGELLTHQPGDFLFWINQVILLIWALLSWVYQAMADRQRHERGARIAWLVTDAATLTILLWNIRAVGTAMVVAYPVLIVASGLWLETRLVRLTTLLAMLGYLLLVIDAIRRNDVPPVHEMLHALTGFAATGAVVAYQIRRSRALRRLAENKPAL